MKMKSVSSLFCAVAFFGTASVAMAGAYGEPEQAEEMPRPAPVAAQEVAPEGFQPFAYLALGGVYGQGFFEDEVHQINKHYGWGVNGRVGYRFHPMFAAELLFEDVIEFDADSGGRGSQNNIDRKVWSLMPNFKFYPIEGFCEPYLSIGGGLEYADSGNDNRVVNAQIPIVLHGRVDQGAGFGMRFGIGADFYATEQIFIAPEVAYVLPITSDVSDYDYLSVSLSVGYAFN
jgi:outer membrane protein W